VAFIDPVGKFCFKVEVEGITAAHFMAVTGISMEIEVLSFVEGGRPDRAHMLPGQGKQGSVTLKRGYVVDPGFYDWFEEVARLGEAAVTIRRDVHLVLCSEEQQELRRWTLERAWPKKWALDDLDANSGAIAVESLELAHFGFLPSGASRRGIEARRGSESGQLGSSSAGAGSSAGGASGGASGGSSSGAGGGSASGPTAFARAAERAARDAEAAVAGRVRLPVIEPPTLTPKSPRGASSLEHAWRHADKRAQVSDPSSFARTQMSGGTPIASSELATESGDEEPRSSRGLVRTRSTSDGPIHRWSDGVDLVQPPALDGRIHFGSVFNE